MLKNISNIAADRNFNFSVKEKAGKKFQAKEEVSKDSVTISEEYELLKQHNCKLYRIKNKKNIIEVTISEAGAVFSACIEIQGNEQGKYAVIEGNAKGYSVSFTFNRSRIDLSSGYKFAYIHKFFESLKKMNVRSEINEAGCAYLETAYIDYQEKMHYELNLLFSLMVKIAEITSGKEIYDTIYRNRFILLKLNHIKTYNE